MIRLGILGAANITSRSVVEPAKKINNIFIHGIASRDYERARTFADKHQIPVVYKDYEDLLKSEDIDAVYIPLANHLHAEMVVKAARYKKHVLVEKPICLSEQEYQKIRQAGDENKVKIIEALMIQHHPWQKEIKKIYEDQRYGKLLHISTKQVFTLEKSDSYRFHTDNGGGVFWDEVSYCCQLIQSFRELNPVKFNCSSDFNGPNGVDMTFKADMTFPDGLTSDFICSYEMPFDSTHILTFEKAKVRIRNFLGPVLGYFKIKFDIKRLDSDHTETITFEPENYYYNQLLYFTEMLHGRQPEIDLNQAGIRTALMEKMYHKALATKGN